MAQTSKLINKFTLAVALLLISIAFLVNPSSSRAIDEPAITVTPGSINVELTSPDQVTESEITISSNYSTATKLTASLNGIDDSTGTLVASGPLPDNLRDSVSLSTEEITIEANSSTKLYLKVINSDNISPGGHYAAVTLSQMSDTTSDIGLQSSISISVFIVKRGGEKIDMEIIKQNLNLSNLGLPKVASLEFLNKGNVHITPRASVTVRSLDGSKVYAKGVANQESFSILPGKTLESTFAIEPTARLPFFPQKLKYITEYRADGVIFAEYSEIQKWYIPPLFMLIFLLLIILSIFFITKLIKKALKQQKHKKGPKTKTKPQQQLIVDVKPPQKKSKKTSL